MRRFTLRSSQPGVWAIVLGQSLALMLATLAATNNPAEPASAETPTLRVVMLPFQNATGDAAWDDWRQALPELAQGVLDSAEHLHCPRWNAIGPALARGGWNETNAVDASLARQVAKELNANVAVWGSFRHPTHGWTVDAKVLRMDSAAAPVDIQATSSRRVDLAESLALGLAKQLERPIAEDERAIKMMYMPDSEQAAQCLAKAIMLESRKAPAADQEKAWRDVLAADPRCGYAHSSLCGLLAEAKRKEDAGQAIREYGRQLPQLCHAHLGLAWLLLEQQDQKGAEREMRAALELHRGCPGAVEQLFLLLSRSERRDDLTKILERAHADRPHERDTAIFLASVRTQSGDLQGADELLRSMTELPEESEVADLVLLQAALATGEVELAGRELQRLGPKAAESERVREAFASFNFTYRGMDATRVDALIVRPRGFTAAELSAELGRRLSDEERKRVVNPIEITPEITAEAGRLTLGMTNDWLRAFSLFAEVASRGRGSGDIGSRTAGEALKDSADSQTRLSCQEHAKLFATLARAIGLEAWMVHVDRCADGSPGYHDCAALFLDGHGVLIDPTWRTFGILHEAFVVMDDIQAISHQAMQPATQPDPLRLRMGLKLNPEDRWTRLQFVRGMAKAGEAEAAAEELRKVQATGVESWDVHEAAAELEMARDRWKPALIELQRSLALSPSNAVVHFKLSHVYSELNDPAKAREHIESALRFDRGEVPQEIRQRSPAAMALLQALATGQSGDRSSRESLVRQAEGGDLPAQMALAKLCFEEQPPRTDEGMRWLLKAAEQGDNQAQYNYGKNLLLLRGAGAGKEAMQWLTRAAEQGNDDAQYLLGLNLYEGKLLPADPVAAGQWILLADAAGNKDARTLLKEMQLFLSAKELAEARKRANDFKPVKRPEATTGP